MGSKRNRSKKLVSLLLIILLILLIISACKKEQNHVTKEERIALEQAELDGYQKPELWKRFGEETREAFQYSIKYNKDVFSWRVSIDTSNNPKIKNTPAAIYFISRETGEVIDIIDGLGKEK